MVNVGVSNVAKLKVVPKTILVAGMIAFSQFVTGNAVQAKVELTHPEWMKAQIENRETQLPEIKEQHKKLTEAISRYRAQRKELNEALQKTRARLIVKLIAAETELLVEAFSRTVTIAGSAGAGLIELGGVILSEAEGQLLGPGGRARQLEKKTKEFTQELEKTLEIRADEKTRFRYYKECIDKLKLLVPELDRTIEEARQKARKDLWKREFQAEVDINTLKLAKADAEIRVLFDKDPPKDRKKLQEWLRWLKKQIGEKATERREAVNFFRLKMEDYSTGEYGLYGIDWVPSLSKDKDKIEILEEAIDDLNYYFLFKEEDWLAGDKLWAIGDAQLAQLKDLAQKLIKKHRLGTPQLQIVKIYASPREVKPGDTVNFNIWYKASGLGEREGALIFEEFEVRGLTRLSPQYNIVVGNKSCRMILRPFEIPKDTQSGKYTFTARVSGSIQGQPVEDTRKSSFTVRDDRDGLITFYVDNTHVEFEWQRRYVIGVWLDEQMIGTVGPDQRKAFQTTAGIHKFAIWPAEKPDDWPPVMWSDHPPPAACHDFPFYDGFVITTGKLY